MAQYITKIRTESGDLQIDYNALANKPVTNNLTPTYTMASTDANLSSGENLSTAFGKIDKAIRTLHGHTANKENPHGITAEGIHAAKDDHDHEGVYATPEDITEALANFTKSDNASDHRHDNLYYTESEMDTKLAGKVPVLAEYYQNDKSADDLLDAFALIPISATCNPELYNILGGMWAFVRTYFYGSVSETSMRTQIAFSYNTPSSKMAIRNNYNRDPNTWTPWQSTTLSSLGVTVTATELNCLDGITSNVQAQLNGKQATISGGATSILSSNLTKNRALVSNDSGKVAVSAVTSTELGYLYGATKNIQTQLDSKVQVTPEYYSNGIDANELEVPFALIPIEKNGLNSGLYDILGGTWAFVRTYFYTGASKTSMRTQIAFSYNTSSSKMAIRNNYDRDPNKWTPWQPVASTVSTTSTTLADLGIIASAGELNHVFGVTSNIQAQLNEKAEKSHQHMIPVSDISDLKVTANELNNLQGLTATAHTLNYVKDVTSNVQTQLNNRLPINIGVAISNNDDLNNYKTPGKYYSGSGTTSATVTNAPTTSSGFGLIVMDGYYPGRVFQIALLNSGTMRMRYYDGSNWSQWASVLTNILPSNSYGASLPTAGTAGRIFFKKA